MAGTAPSRISATARHTIARVARALNPGGPLIVLMTDDQIPLNLAAVLAGLPRGGWIIIRARAPALRAAMGRAAIGLARPRGIKVLIAADWALALRLRADGVHWPEADIAQAAGFRRRFPGLILTAAAHGPRGLRMAQAIGADAAILSPVFSTKSHARAQALGPVRFAAMTHRAGLPVLALGGIDASRARRLKGTGASGLALIRGWVASCST